MSAFTSVLLAGGWRWGAQPEPSLLAIPVVLAADAAHKALRARRGHG